jgi:two-component system, chemotaxis family, sensor kinase CheA
MDFKDDGFFKELLTIFRAETAEHIQAMLSGVDELERAQGTDKQFEVAEPVHRAAHSLKGAARTIGLADVEPICQSLETFFSVMKRQKVTFAPGFANKLKKTVQNLQTLLDTLNEEGKVTGDRAELTRQIEDLQSKMVTMAR